MASTSSISGLVSGLDTASIVSKLMEIESRPQALVKSQLSTAQGVARALREINTSLALLSSSAQALTTADAFTGRTATSSSKDVAVSATGAARPGTGLTFTVTALAAAQTSLSSATWSSPSGDARTAATDSADPALDWPITVLAADGTTAGVIDIPPGASLDAAADAINKKGIGLTAAVLRLDSTHYKLQVTSTASGAGNAFTVRGAGETDGSGPAFRTLNVARDAELQFGGATASSPTNTFADLLTGVTVTVSQVSATPTTVGVAIDNAGITAKVQALVTAAGTALATLAKYSDNSLGSAAVMKGNTTLTRLTTEIRDQLSRAVAGSSPALAGVQLTRDGTVTFDAARFGALLQSDPTTAMKPDHRD